MSEKSFRSKACEKRLLGAAQRWCAAEVGRKLLPPKFDQSNLLWGLFLFPAVVGAAIWGREFPEWRVAWCIAVSALLAVPWTNMQFHVKPGEVLSILPVSHRKIADQVLRTWRILLIGGTLAWFSIGICIPAEGRDWGHRICYGAMAGAGFLCAGSLWWLWSLVPWRARWLLPTVVAITLLAELIFHDIGRFPRVSALLESTSLILPWQWGLVELRRMNAAAFLPWLVLMLTAGFFWIRWIHQRVRALYRFDRLDIEEEVLEGDDDLPRNRLHDALENDEVVWTDGNSFTPPAPVSLNLLERLLWKWLNPEQRWLANIGGISNGNFLKRQGAAFLFMAIPLMIGWVVTHLLGDEFNGWVLLSIVVGILLAGPWGSTTTGCWCRSVGIAMGVNAPVFRFFPISLRQLVGLRIKEIVLKGIVALPVLCLGVTKLGQMMTEGKLKLRLGVTAGELLRPAPFLLLAIFALLSLAFANSIVAEAFGRKSRGISARTTIQLLIVGQFLVAVACVVVACMSIDGQGVLVSDYLVKLGILAGLLLLHVSLLAVLIRWRMASPRCDLLVVS